MSKELDKIEQFERDLLKELLYQCTEKQRGVFAKGFPDGPDEMERCRIPSAILLCERTIQNNKRKEIEVQE